MPIHSPWRPASTDHVRLNVPHEPGVYELKSFGNLVYIGKADDLQEAVLDHLDDRSPNYYRVETPELLESADDLYERHLHRYEREHEGAPTWNESEHEDTEETTTGEAEPTEADETTERSDSAEADEEETVDDEAESDPVAADEVE
ncbi:MAG: DUF7508 domain-containing protein [Halanaeroarchaeum sp.]